MTAWQYIRLIIRMILNSFHFHSVVRILIISFCGPACVLALWPFTFEKNQKKILDEFICLFRGAGQMSVVCLFATTKLWYHSLFQSSPCLSSARLWTENTDGAQVDNNNFELPSVNWTLWFECGRLSDWTIGHQAFRTRRRPRRRCFNDILTTAKQTDTLNCNPPKTIRVLWSIRAREDTRQSGMETIPDNIEREMRDNNIEFLLTCQTPTMAFAIKINKMTKGSTKAVNESSCSSNRANTWKIWQKIEKKSMNKPFIHHAVSFSMGNNSSNI